MSSHRRRNRPFLKWLGGKTRLIERITAALPSGQCLAEPFVGSASVFLNTEFEHYLLNDINSDLINLYRHLQQDAKELIPSIKKLFQAKHNREKSYYSLRDRFNSSSCTLERSALFVYLNRHGYNGLCRYNRKGFFNVPFGRYVTPYFPQEELLHFVEFSNYDYRNFLETLPNNIVIYCDPPYVPLTKTANFTSYSSKAFQDEEQEWLARFAQEANKRKQTCLISNHDTAYTRKLYAKAEISSFHVPRFVSAKANQRTPVRELLALYSR